MFVFPYVYRWKIIILSLFRVIDDRKRLSALAVTAKQLPACARPLAAPPLLCHTTPPLHKRQCGGGVTTLIPRGFAVCVHTASIHILLSVKWLTMRKYFHYLPVVGIYGHDYLVFSRNVIIVAICIVRSRKATNVQYIKMLPFLSIISSVVSGRGWDETNTLDNIKVLNLDWVYIFSTTSYFCMHAYSRY